VDASRAPGSAPAARHDSDDDDDDADYERDGTYDDGEDRGSVAGSFESLSPAVSRHNSGETPTTIDKRKRPSFGSGSAPSYPPGKRPSAFPAAHSSMSLPPVATSQRPGFVNSLPQSTSSGSTVPVVSSSRSTLEPHSVADTSLVAVAAAAPQPSN
jgi:hypothetical protein